jgi:hypothetical protein
MPQLVWRAMDLSAPATHIAELVVRKVTPQKGEKNCLVEFALVKGIRGAFLEKPEATFLVNTLVFRGPVRGLPAAAVNALWCNTEPFPGEHYGFFGTRSDPAQKVSLAVLLEDFKKEKVYLSNLSSPGGGLELWALSQPPAPPGTEWVAEASSAGDKLLRVRMLWVKKNAGEPLQILLPERVVNNALFTLDLHTRSGVQVPMHALTGDWAAGGVVDMALTEGLAFEYVIDISSWFAWSSVPEKYWVRAHFAGYAYAAEEAHYWKGKIDFPLLAVQWTGRP